MAQGFVREAHMESAVQVFQPPNMKSTQVSVLLAYCTSAHNRLARDGTIAYYASILIHYVVVYSIVFPLYAVLSILYYETLSYILRIRRGYHGVQPGRHQCPSRYGEAA